VTCVLNYRVGGLAYFDKRVVNRPQVPSQMEAEAENAAKFLHHSSPMSRKWAHTERTNQLVYAAHLRDQNREGERNRKALGITLGGICCNLGVQRIFSTAGHYDPHLTRRAAPRACWPIDAHSSPSRWFQP
jgi:hypothetical protein